MHRGFQNLTKNHSGMWPKAETKLLEYLMITAEVCLANAKAGSPYKLLEIINTHHL